MLARFQCEERSRRQASAWAAQMPGCPVTLNWKFKAAAAVAVIIGGGLVLRGEDAATNAQLACERHVEATTTHDLSEDEVASMRVHGDATNGKVQGAFFRDGVLRYAVCEFENGQPRRVSVDGSGWPDVDQSAIRRLNVSHAPRGATDDTSASPSPAPALAPHG